MLDTSCKPQTLKPPSKKSLYVFLLGRQRNRMKGATGLWHSIDLGVNPNSTTDHLCDLG